MNRVTVEQPWYIVIIPTEKHCRRTIGFFYVQSPPLPTTFIGIGSKEIMINIIFGCQRGTKHLFKVKFKYPNHAPRPKSNVCSKDFQFKSSDENRLCSSTALYTMTMIRIINICAIIYQCCNVANSFGIYL